MLHILLTILEIIGIVLAVLLGFVLLILISLLFVPICYRAEGSGSAGQESKGVQADISIAWLFVHCRGRISFPPREMRWILRLFFFPVYDSMKRSGRQKEEEDAPEWEELKLEESIPEIEAGSPEEAAESDGIQPEHMATEWESVVQGAAEGEAAKQEILGMDDTTDDRGDCDHAGEGSPRNPESTGAKNADQTEGERGQDLERESSQQEESSRLEKMLDGVYQKLYAVAENIRYTIQKICDKIKRILGNITYYMEILRGEEFSQAFVLVKKELLRSLRSIRPRKWEIKIEAGLGDPASTGQLTAFYGMLYPWIGRHVVLQPDFENKRVETEALFKGRITLAVLILVAARLYFNKNLKRVIGMLKHVEKEET